MEFKLLKEADDVKRASVYLLFRLEELVFGYLSMKQGGKY